jgi:septum formation protein
MPERVVLASASASRAQLLLAAGVAVEVEPSGIDEEAVKRQVRGSGGLAIDCALCLAQEKARAVSARQGNALVIGADQILVLGDRWFDKPASVEAAREQLRMLCGRRHVLATAACVVHDGNVLWRGTSEPALTMRAFSDAFLEAYLTAEGEAVLGSVGSYRIEGRGVQLFSGIDGDYFAILGLPLLPLLGFLRERGVIAS